MKILMKVILPVFLAMCLLGSSGMNPVAAFGYPPPTITSFFPTSGPPGTQVTIYGTNLRWVAEIMFGASDAASRIYYTDTDTQQTAWVGNGSTGVIGVYCYNYQTGNYQWCYSADTFTLTKTLVSIALAPASPDILAVGSYQQFTVTGTYSDNSTADITSQMYLGVWNYSYNGVATVNWNGLTKGVSAGQSIISAYLFGIHSNSVTLTVGAPAPALSSIAVTPASPDNLAVGADQQFDATGTYSDNSTADITSQVTWSSSHTGIATISSGGLATGVAVGSTDIRADLSGITSDTVTLTVTKKGIVTFPDPKLKAAILAALGRSSGDITLADAQSITYLAASNQGITDLTGLHYCTNLTNLYLSFNQIGDISELASLTKLLELNLGWNYKISDISSLSGLTSLFNLVLSSNNISVISPLAKLTNLTNLNLDDTQISDLSALKSLTLLQSLNLYSNNIDDISPLTSLTSLTSLNLDWNQISETSSLSNLTQLNTLYLSGNDISDVSGLSKLTALETLELKYNQINDISSLNTLTNLSYLYLYGNQINDIYPLSDLTQLQVLDLGVNYISDISPLSGLTNLQALYIEVNDLIDISPLTGLTQLNQVYVSYNYLDISTGSKDMAVINALENKSVAVDYIPQTSVLSSIAIRPAAPASLLVGSKLQFQATGTYDDGFQADLTSKVDWNSSNTSFATISASGLATGIGGGSTNITATLSGVTSTPVTLPVTAPPPPPPPTPVLHTTLTNVTLPSHDPGVTSVSVTAAAVPPVGAPAGFTPGSAYVVDTTGTGSFTLSFTVTDAAHTQIYKINPDPPHNWILQNTSVSGNIITLTLKTGDPTFVFGTSPVSTAGQTWKLDSETTLADNTPLPAGYFEMEKAQGPDDNGQTGSVSVASQNNLTWLADQKAAADVTFSSGQWTIKLTTPDTDWSSACSAQVGDYTPGGAFSAFNSTPVSGTYNGGIITITLTAGGTVTKDHQLALKIFNNNGTSHTITTTGSSYLASPSSTPPYPVPELAAGVLLVLGLAGLSSYVVIRRRKPTRMHIG